MTREPFTRPIRSVLITPATRDDLLAKLGPASADVVMIDCEGNVQPDQKASARHNASQFGSLLAEQGMTVIVRVNAVPTAWFSDDIARGLAHGIAGVVVPKVETTEQLDDVRTTLDRAGYEALGIVAGIETCLGVADARELLSHPAVFAAYFGSEDFLADLGGRHMHGANDHLLMPRSQIALAGRVAGVVTLDQAFVDFRDTQAFRHEAIQARSLGFAGKLCIHPTQVELANEAFAPSSDEIIRARALLETYRNATAARAHRPEFDGQVVREATIAQAKRTLALTTIGPVASAQL